MVDFVRGFQQIGPFFNNTIRRANQQVNSVRNALIPDTVLTPGKSDPVAGPSRESQVITGNKNVVRLRSKNNTLDIVKINLTPDLSESGNVMYDEIADLMAPGSIFIYSGSPGRTFQISARFLSRTTAESDTTRNYINLIRSWRMPQRTFAYSPPEPLLLSGYGSVFKSIPVILTDYSFDISSETDYMPTSDGSLIPIVQGITMTLRESHSVDEMKQFNIEQFKRGMMSGY